MVISVKCMQCGKMAWSDCREIPIMYYLYKQVRCNFCQGKKWIQYNVRPFDDERFICIPILEKIPRPRKGYWWFIETGNLKGYFWGENRDKAFLNALDVIEPTSLGMLIGIRKRLKNDLSEETFQLVVPILEKYGQLQK